MHELVVVDLHPAVAIGVESGEGLADLLDDDARAHEAVERDPIRLRSARAWAGTCVHVCPTRGDLVSLPSLVEESRPKQGQPESCGRVSRSVRKC